MKNHMEKLLVGGFILGILLFSPAYGEPWDTSPSYDNNGTADFEEINSIVRGSLGCRMGEPLDICQSRVSQERERLYLETMRRQNKQQFGNFERSIFDIGRKIDEWVKRPRPGPRARETQKDPTFNPLSDSSNVKNYNCTTDNARTGDAVNDFAHGIFEDMARWERRQNGNYSAEDKAIDEHCAKWAKEMAPLIDAQLAGSKIKTETAKRNLERKRSEENWEYYKTWKNERRHVN